MMGRILAKSATGAVAIIVAVEFGGFTGRAYAQVLAPPVAASLDELHRECLAAGLARAEQKSLRLQRSLPPLKSEVEQLIEKLSAATPPPKDAAEENRAVKAVEFRPPMAYTEKQGKQQILLVCENGRIAAVDFDALNTALRTEDFQQRAGKASDQAKVTKVAQEVIGVTDRGHFDLRLQCEVEEERVIEQVMVRRKSGHDGADASCLTDRSSQIRRLIDQSDPNEVHIFFIVYPSSFDIFRAVRKYVWSKDGLEVGWAFLPPEEPVRLGGGGGATLQ